MCSDVPLYAADDDGRIYTTEDLPADPDFVEPGYDVLEALLNAAEAASRDRYPDVDYILE